MVPPAATGLGAPALDTARSQYAYTGVVMLVPLFPGLGSDVDEETDEAAVIDATATDGATFTTTMMSAEAPDARLGFVQVTLPVAPAAGVVQAQPAGTEIEAKVVFVGTASRKLTAEAAAGPLFVTVWMYVMSLPAYTDNGVPAVLSARSACNAELATGSTKVAEFDPNA